jgi:plasmid stability protein
MNLSIKNVPEDIYQQVKQAAAEQGRSLNAQIVQILAAEAAEAGRRRRMRESRKKLERFVASLPKMSGSERLIRKDRDR